MKKTLITAILLICVFLSLCACGTASQTPSSSDPAPVVVNEPTTEPSAAPADPTGSAAPVDVPEATPEAPVFNEEKFNAASALIGEDISLLYDAIGEPLDSYYTPSCMVTDPGDNAEDGELTYEGFYVVSFRKDGKEIVWDVIRDVE